MASVTRHADQASDIRGLPGRTECNERFFDSHVLPPVPEFLAVDAIAVSEQETGSSLKRDRLDNLLSGPLGRGSTVTLKWTTPTGKTRRDATPGRFVHGSTIPRWKQPDKQKAPDGGRNRTERRVGRAQRAARKL